MNTKSNSLRPFPFALLILALLWQVPAYAQQTYDYWNQPANSGFTANRSSALRQQAPAYRPSLAQNIPATTDPEAARIEFERVRSAWESYRREAIRYQSRFGEQDFLRSGGRRFESRSPAFSPVNNVTSPGSVRNVQSTDFDSRGFERSGPSGQCRNHSRRRAADTRPQLSPAAQGVPFQELDRGQLRPFSESRPYSEVRESFRNPQPLRAVPIGRRPEFDPQSDTGTGLFSTPKIDPSQLASRAQTFFSSHLGN